MKRVWSALCGRVAVTTALMMMAAAAHAAVEEGFVALFNGENLDGWTGDPRLWRVENGHIVGSTDNAKIEQNTFLYTDKTYTDFELRVSFKLRNGNSGVQFRSEVSDDYVVAGYQGDIAEKTYTGMLYEEKKRGIMDYWKNLSPEEQAAIFANFDRDGWNNYVITCQDDHIKMELNGATVLDFRDPEGAREGVIALQLHVGPPMEVQFKDIHIKEFTDAEKTAALLPDFNDATRRERLDVGGSRFRIPEGFEVTEVATNELTGSLINMTFDAQGRPSVSAEGHGIRILLDENNDGIFDAQKDYSDAVRNAQGMYWLAPGDLLVHADGPGDPSDRAQRERERKEAKEKGEDDPGPRKDITGMYRLRDTDGDDVADDITLVGRSNGGIGEHGPHAIAMGPDGYLYTMYGNHAHAGVELAETSPSRGLEEDYLLPRYVDPRGHANNIRAPGGTIVRLDPNMENWEQLLGGFRNAYDFAMNTAGEILTFDSDMEWDFGLPWFRPVRVIHCVPGADYGWRTGSSKMPDYYIDTLPAIDDVGRGSPVGTAFYYGDAYPDMYHGAFIMGDWSRGRIRITFPERDGATFSGETVDFVVGEPLNVTDLDIAPDGFMYFTVGGRGTHGGMFRLAYTGDDVTQPAMDSDLAKVLHQSMPRSAWGKQALRDMKDKMGDAWEPQLLSVINDANRATEERLRALEALQVLGPKPRKDQLVTLSNDSDAAVRAQAVYLLGAMALDEAGAAIIAKLDDSDPLVLRRACEALVRADLTPANSAGLGNDLVNGILALLDHNDRFVRYAAEQTLERIQRNAWAQHVLADDINQRPHGALEGLLALIRTHESKEQMDAVFAKLAEYSKADLSDDAWLDYLRVLQLAYIRDAKDADRSAFNNEVAPRLLAMFPASDWRLNRELQVMLAHQQSGDAIGPMLAYLTPDKSQQEQIHTVFCLRAIKDGWTKDQRQQLVEWFDRGREMAGAASMEGYINNLWASAMEVLPEDERVLAEQRKQEALEKRAQEAIELLAKAQESGGAPNSELAQMSFEELSEYLEYDPMAYRANLEHGKMVFIRSKCANCHVFGTIGKGGGPDLSTLVSRFRRRDILEAIMYPNRVVSDQYVTVELELDDFTDVTGMVAGESDDTLTIITIDGDRREIPKEKIVERTESKTSVMPEGLLYTMSLGDLVSLINFLERGAEIDLQAAAK